MISLIPNLLLPDELLLRAGNLLGGQALGASLAISSSSAAFTSSSLSGEVAEVKRERAAHERPAQWLLPTK